MKIEIIKILLRSQDFDQVISRKTMCKIHSHKNCKTHSHKYIHINCSASQRNYSKEATILSFYDLNYPQKTLKQTHWLFSNVY